MNKNIYKTTYSLSFFEKTQFFLISLFSFTIPWGTIYYINGSRPLYGLFDYGIFLIGIFIFLFNKKIPINLSLLISFLIFLSISCFSWIFGPVYSGKSFEPIFELCTRFLLFIIILQLNLISNLKIKIQMAFCLGALFAFILLFCGYNVGYIGRFWLKNGNPNDLGFVFCIASIFILSMLNHQSKRLRMLFSIFIPIFFLGLILTGSRSAGIAEIVILFLYFFLINKTNLSYKIMITLCFLFIILFAYYQFESHFKIITRWDSQLDHRTIIWTRAINLFYEKPWIGYGPGSFQNLVHFYSSGLQFAAPENIIILEIVEVGIIGLIAFSFLIFSILHLSFQRCKNKRDLVFKLMLSSVIFLYLLTQSGYYSQLTWFAFAILAA
jgi:O-antigen ligase